MKKTIRNTHIKNVLNSVINERDEMKGFEEIEVKPKKIIRLTEQDIFNLVGSLLGKDLKTLLSPDFSGSKTSSEKKDSGSEGSSADLEKILKQLSPQDKEKFEKYMDDKSDSKTPKDFGPSSSISSNFNSMVEKIIDEFEGGYYDPKTMKNSAMGDSGETMYGIDKKHGPESKTGKGYEFWELIRADREKNPTCYKLEYDPAKAKGKCYNPSLAKKLKSLIADMMKPRYEEYTRKYFSPEAKKIVDSDPGLTFNFVYAVWNGSGWFQRFAKVINKEVENGNKEPKKLLKVAIDTRKNWSNSSGFANNLINRSGREMEKILMA